MLLICNPAGEVLLQQRPSPGLWGGLWCLPEIPAETDARLHCQSLCGQQLRDMAIWPGWRHTFSHFHLDLTPVLLLLAKPVNGTAEPGTRWVDPANPGAIGLAAPVKRLLDQLAASR